MIHTISVVVETESDSPDIGEAIQSEIKYRLGYVSATLGLLSAVTAPITGIQRQHLIGETDND